ncbi:hypothetical protein LMG33818_000889 [Halomonadaceae bacterium LMG 33818]|uniref:hypothetical protein n=1 Tax=Cernens ardua TaxID=3402176 RepID=UPI003EDC0B2D
MAFDKNLMGFIDDVTDDITELQRVISMQVLAEVVSLSPVGDRTLWKINKEREKRGLKGLLPKGYIGGAFRANHIVSLGTPDNSYNVQNKDEVGNKTIAAGNEKIAESRPFTVIYIQNNMPYAVRLEQGWSTQAPAGWFMTAFDRVAEAYA